MAAVLLGAQHREDRAVVRVGAEKLRALCGAAREHSGLGALPDGVEVSECRETRQRRNEAEEFT
jgi:hypothetical protein